MKTMETIERKCDNCGKTVYILEGFMREKMFCTLGCMSESENKKC